MAYDAWTEGYLKAKQSKANKFDPNISIRFERVGNWIVSTKVLGGWCSIGYSRTEARKLMHGGHGEFMKLPDGLGYIRFVI